MMLHEDEFMISLDCEPIELANPEARASIKEVDHQLETAGILPLHHVYARSGTITASVASLGPYLVPIAVVTIAVLGKILIAWVKVAPSRRVRLKIGNDLIEAKSVKDVERLIPLLKELQAKGGRKKPEA